jgi:formylglycine-generating enzyme required for sulfatase activity
MNCITWFEAMAFCIWDGGFLPTEAEWNYAATGGDDQRAYPWSDPAGTLTIDGSHANYNDETRLVSVGTKPMGDGRWGQSDLAGNVFEWTLDWYASAYPIPCADCANLVQSSFRVFRGGNFGVDATYLRAGYRDSNIPTVRFIGVGVRCARTP